jgi:hypothetical protein
MKHSSFPPPAYTFPIQLTPIRNLIPLPTNKLHPAMITPQPKLPQRIRRASVAVRPAPFVAVETVVVVRYCHVSLVSVWCCWGVRRRRRRRRRRREVWGWRFCRRTGVRQRGGRGMGIGRGVRLGGAKCAGRFKGEVENSGCMELIGILAIHLWGYSVARHSHACRCVRR